MGDPSEKNRQRESWQTGQQASDQPEAPQTPLTPSRQQPPAAGPPSQQHTPQQYQQPGPPSQQYAPPGPPSQQYAPPGPQSQQYTAPATPSQQYSPPGPPSQQYAPPSPQSGQQYSPPAPSSQPFTNPGYPAQPVPANQPADTGPDPSYQTGQVSGAPQADDGVIRISLPKPGELIADRYEVLCELGLGGFGAVYKAHQRGIEKEIALKVLLPQAAAIEGSSERFKREAMLAKKLGHPNTVQLFDYGTTNDGLTFIAMELLNGATLEQEIVTSGGIPPERVTIITEQILKSLSEAHANGIVHRDLKPANVMLVEIFGEKDFVKVLDFGIARALEDAADEYKTRTGTVIGTPQYMAPEQLKGEEVGPPVDVYATGLIMAEMLTGAKVFDEDNTNMVIVAQLSAGDVPLGEEVLRGELGAVVYKATAKNPNYRYQTVIEMLDALRNPGPPPTTGQIQTRLNESQGTDVLANTHTAGGQTRDTGPGLVIGSDVIKQGTTRGMPPLGEKSKLPLILLFIFILIGGAGFGLFIATRDDGNTGGNRAAVDPLTDPSTGPSTGEVPRAPAGNEANSAVQTAGFLANHVWRTANMVMAPTAPVTVEGLVRLVVISQPSDASVFRGETLLGQTPFNADVTASDGEETLVIRRNGYLDTRMVVDLSRNSFPDNVTLQRQPRTRSERTSRRENSRRQGPPEEEPTGHNGSDHSGSTHIPTLEVNEPERSVPPLPSEPQDPERGEPPEERQTPDDEPRERRSLPVLGDSAPSPPEEEPEEEPTRNTLPSL